MAGRGWVIFLAPEPTACGPPPLHTDRQAREPVLPLLVSGPTRPREANRDIQPGPCEWTGKVLAAPQGEVVVLRVSKPPYLHHGLRGRHQHVGRPSGCSGCKTPRPDLCLPPSATWWQRLDIARKCACSPERLPPFGYLA